MSLGLTTIHKNITDKYEHVITNMSHLLDIKILYHFKLKKSKNLFQYFGYPLTFNTFGSNLILICDLQLFKHFSCIKVEDIKRRLCHNINSVSLQFSKTHCTCYTMKKKKLYYVYQTHKQVHEYKW